MTTQAKKPASGKVTLPYTGKEFLESLDDGREIWIYGQRVKKITEHPAFQNTARMIARLYVVIGGIGTIEGPIIGTLLFFALRETMADFGTWYLIVLGALAVVVMVRFPRGLWGYVAQRFDLHLFPVRRRLVSPAEGWRG
jgi:hypothetical protein